jgi:hypothetical protein
MNARTRLLLSECSEAAGGQIQDLTPLRLAAVLSPGFLARKMPVGTWTQTQRAF